MIYLYLLVLLVLGVYSYSQIDLNLTLLQSPIFLKFQEIMIQLGYFNRPLSTVIFMATISLFFGFYIYFLKNPPKKFLLLMLGTILLGLFSYPAFSHDIYNYIFDARIFAFHHANPYTSTALMFPSDTWTRFMNWTHRTYPYGPIFLPLSILIYFLGFNKFIWTLFLFKLLAIAAYLGCCFIIFKLAKSRGLLLFALNPLVILEAVISSHHDIVMLFFGLLAYYFLIQKKKIFSLLSLAISVGIKYSTILFLPFFLWTKLNYTRRLQLIIITAYVGTLFQIGSRELLPHYFIVPFGFSALSTNRFVILGVLILSFILLVIRYYGFISTGSWTT